MKYDDYAAAVDAERLRQCLERCRKDSDHHVEECAQAAVEASCCPCIASESMICNALTRSISETFYSAGIIA